MKTTLILGGILGIFFVKKIMKKYPSIDKETILEWKNSNLIIKIVRSIIIIVFGAIPKIFFSIIEYEKNSFFEGIIYEILTSVLNGFFIYGLGLLYSCLLFNLYINKTEIDDLNSFSQLISNETNKNINDDEKDDAFEISLDENKINEKV